jgi:hypothetical protein
MVLFVGHQWYLKASLNIAEGTSGNANAVVCREAILIPHLHAVYMMMMRERSRVHAARARTGNREMKDNSRR